MEPRRLLETLAVADRLKDTTRHCYTLEGGRRESVAEHSWRAALMAYFRLGRVSRDRYGQG